MNQDLNLGSPEIKALSRLLSIHTYAALWLLVCLLTLFCLASLLAPLPRYTQGTVSYPPAEVQKVEDTTLYVTVPFASQLTALVDHLVGIRTAASTTDAFQIARIRAIRPWADTDQSNAGSVFNEESGDWMLLELGLEEESVARQFKPGTAVQLQTGNSGLLDLLLA